MHTAVSSAVCVTKYIGRGQKVTPTNHPPPSLPFDHQMMEGSCEGNKYVDMFSKWFEVFPTKAADSAAKQLRIQEKFTSDQQYSGKREYENKSSKTSSRDCLRNRHLDTKKQPRPALPPFTLSHGLGISSYIRLFHLMDGLAGREEWSRSPGWVFYGSRPAAPAYKSSQAQYNPSTEFWVYVDVSYQLDMPGKGKVPRRHPDPMPEPPQLAPFNTKEQRLYSKLPLDD
ncbi:hypothetical protein N1851_007783 [Merluccius polli]|uniref:Uncharacterized protein n=1 Tax=Merluccius polli TaxID=89951 RepID=A0AA47N2G6_MERPO|nr:hypothetical protein N1851_007783 [Merluccius polli]